MAGARRLWLGPGAGDEEVDEAAGARLPVGNRFQVGDADEGAEEVEGVHVIAEYAGFDRPFHEGSHGFVDGGVGGLDYFGVASGGRIEGGGDDFLGGDVVDEEEHPGAEGFERREGFGEFLFRSGEFFDLGAIDGFEEVLAGGEVAVESAGADAGLFGDVVEAGAGAEAGEGAVGGGEDAFAVAFGVGAALAGGGLGAWGGHGQK
jgi:hypothetical protein